jgi:hypothetical protein
VEPTIEVPPPVEEVIEASMTSKEGSVEVRRGQDWVPANAGDKLGFDDSLRTAADSTAELQLGDVNVVLEPRSEVTVREMSDQVSNLRLDKGLLSAKIQGGGKQKLRVRAAGSSAVAEADEGAFTVFNDGKGLVAVAPSAGEVKLTSNGGDQILAVGQRGVVTDDNKPSVHAVPRKVLLSVNWPEDELARPQDTLLKGTVESTTRVEINGAQVPVDREGNFQVPVSVKRGKNPISIVARDISGTTRTSKGSIEVSPGAPKASADTKDLWKKK